MIHRQPWTKRAGRESSCPPSISAPRRLAQSGSQVPRRRTVTSRSERRVVGLWRIGRGATRWRASRTRRSHRNGFGKRFSKPDNGRTCKARVLGAGWLMSPHLCPPVPRRRRPGVSRRRTRRSIAEAFEMKRKRTLWRTKKRAAKNCPLPNRIGGLAIREQLEREIVNQPDAFHREGT